MHRSETSHKLPFLLAALVVSIALHASAASPPTVAVAVTGSPLPGSVVTAKATITTTDGSAVTGIRWKQTGGPVATVLNDLTDMVTITLPSRGDFRQHLIEVLEEPPISETSYPSFVPVREFMGGLQNRFTVVGISPHALTDAAALRFDIEIVTTSGTYHSSQTVAATLPWRTAIGVNNVPTGVPVLVHGKEQPSYNWTLAAPEGSSAKLVDPTSQDPEFTPDMKGVYKLTVTDLASSKPVTMTIYAGTWKGIVTGQDSKGRPVAAAECTVCHVGLIEKFGPWAQTGHAEIFTQNVTNPNGHYSSNCVSCHTVGYDPAANNGGIDDASDFASFLTTDLLTHGDPLNWTKMLQQFPASAKLANIQCENCHGPQNSDGHATWGTARTTLSSDTCGTCHGEPKRHARYQQWQLSSHANYELAGEEGTSGSCAKCHSAQGFLAWKDAGFSAANVSVTWTKDDIHPITCAVCHDPHGVGTTSGADDTNAPMRVMGTTPKLDAGFTATNVGKAAICMTCHNGRRGLRNDATFTVADSTRAPHLGPQTDVLMGQNLYFTSVGNRGFHGMIADSCVTCHMNSTDPPSELSMASTNGTNHSFFASKTICSKCHTSITAESIQEPVETKMEALKVELEKAIKGTMLAQIRAGNSIDFNGQKTVKTVSDITSVELIETHGRQGVNVTLAGGVMVSDLSLQTVKVVRPAGVPVELYAVADPNIAKAGWNYFMIHADSSHGVHNPAFVNSALDLSLFALKAANAAIATPVPGSSSAKLGGGLGNGAGAVGCTTPYVYWSEVAGHIEGAAGSQWRTDMVTRNLGGSEANVKFILHQATGDLVGSGKVGGGAQKAFEDVVGQMGATSALGSLEICSDQPLLVQGRIFNEAEEGTFGQSMDGQVADVGYGAGQTINLIGLRQKSGLYRSNLSVTNGGTTEAQVSVTLFDATGASLKTFTITVPAGKVVMENEPFRTRANNPDVGWGFATVTVLKGTNVWSTASLIDARTNDPTTIPAKQ